MKLLIRVIVGIALLAPAAAVPGHAAHAQFSTEQQDAGVVCCTPAGDAVEFSSMSSKATCIGTADSPLGGAGKTVNSTQAELICKAIHSRTQTAIDDLLKRTQQELQTPSLRAVLDAVADTENYMLRVFVKDLTADGKSLSEHTFRFARETGDPSIVQVTEIKDTASEMGEDIVTRVHLTNFQGSEQHIATMIRNPLKTSVDGEIAQTIAAYAAKKLGDSGDYYENIFAFTSEGPTVVAKGLGRAGTAAYTRQYKIVPFTAGNLESKSSELRYTFEVTPELVQGDYFLQSVSEARTKDDVWKSISVDLLRPRAQEAAAIVVQKLNQAAYATTNDDSALSRLEFELFDDGVSIYVHQTYIPFYYTPYAVTAVLSKGNYKFRV